jgi:alpha-ketoglutarate-dependent taurine dioxygenase
VTVSVTPLTASFAARIDGVDIARPIDDAAWATVRAALDEHSVLVFRRRRTTSSRSPSAVASARSRSRAA